MARRLVLANGANGSPKNRLTKGPRRERAKCPLTPRPESSAPLAPLTRSRLEVVRWTGRLPRSASSLGGRLRYVDHLCRFLRRCRCGPAYLVPDADVMGLLQEEEADYGRHRCDAYGINEAPVVDRFLATESIPAEGSHDQGGGDERDSPTEPAVTEVVGDRERRVADPRREQLDEVRRDGPVDHGHVDHLDEHDADQEHVVDLVAQI